MVENDVKKQLGKAKKAYQSKDFETSNELYSKLYQEHGEDFTDWDNRFYAWALYQYHVKDPKSREELIDAGERITTIVNQSNHSKKDGPCAYTLTVLKIMDYLDDDWDSIIYWSEKLNPDFLSQERFEFMDSNGKQRFLPSKKEKWYSLTSKALLKIDECDEAIEVSKEALANLNEFTNDSDIWFKWKIAKALKELSEYDEALDYLKEVKQVKHDWFVNGEIAEDYFFKNDLENALKYAVAGALSRGDIDKKINLYSLIEDILKMDGKIKEADKHAYLIYAIRHKNDWNIDDDLESCVKEAGFNLEDDDYFAIEKELHELWEEYKYQNQELKTGTIVSILANGKAGFIDDGSYNDNIYFNMYEFKGDKKLAKKGQFVSFYEAEGFDKKKNKKVINAVNVSPKEFMG